jgi:hypothetical protein
MTIGDKPRNKGISKKAYKIRGYVGGAVILALAIVGATLAGIFIPKANNNGFVSGDDKLVLYHLKGCPYCVNLMPTWNKLKAKYGAHMNEFEANEHPDLMKHKNIHSYPTIMFGNTIYDGARTYKDLEMFLLKHLNK